VGVIFIRYGLSLWHQNNMHDFADTLKTANIPFPIFSGYLCKSTEFFGRILLITGFLRSVASVLLITDMTVATFCISSWTCVTKLNDHISPVDLLSYSIIICAG